MKTLFTRFAPCLLFLSFPTPSNASDYLEKHCLDCHDSDSRKGGLDLTHLPSDFNAAFETWIKIHDRIAADEMPPKKKSRPPKQETALFLDVLGKRLHTEDLQRRSTDGRASVRRLTRAEYQNTLRDLLELPHLEVADLLPPDGQRAGFDKLGEALDFSEIQLQQFLAAAKRALVTATCTQSTPPPVLKKRLYPNWIKFAQALEGGDALLLKGLAPDPRFTLAPPTNAHRRSRFENNGISRSEFVSSNTQPVGIIRASDPSKYRSFPFSAPADGIYRLRASSWSFLLDQQKIRPNDRTEIAALWSGNRLLGYFDAPSLKPSIHEWTAPFSAGDGIRFETETVRHARKDIALYTGPGIAIDWIEVEGPLYSQWPPASHRVLFGELPLRSASPDSPKKRPGKQGASNTAPESATVFSQDPEKDAALLLGRFLPKAFRRAVPREELARYTEIVRDQLRQGASFQNAMFEAYQTALCSVHFLFRIENQGPLDGNALATRLAFWLWNSAPDTALLHAGASGQLAHPQGLAQQIDRLLNDPRSQRFIRDFLDQWLNLQKLEDTTPDRDLYPEFNHHLQESMAAESRAYFQELIRLNLGVEHVVASNFAMLNGPLAALYQIPNVDGHTIQKVALPKNSVRGGFIAQAAPLKATANGTTTSPVVRGAWFNERILGLPLAPPPPNVGAVEPDTRGATTIREQLEKHRRDASCAACHERIDPPGFALESFDVIGGLRSHYRSLGAGIPVSTPIRDGNNPPRYKQGPAVDCSGQLPNGESFQDLHQFRARLLDHRDLLAKNLITQLLVYATGSELHFADRPALQKLLDQSRTQNHGIRSMIHLIAQSDLFKIK
jgi:hypothetical protein